MGAIRKTIENIVARWQRFVNKSQGLDEQPEPQEKCKYILDSVFPSQEIRDEVMNYIHSLQQWYNKSLIGKKQKALTIYGGCLLLC